MALAVRAYDEPSPYDYAQDPGGPNNQALYQAWAAPGTPLNAAGWKIRQCQFDSSGNFLGWRWAVVNGRADFNIAFTDRAKQTYLTLNDGTE